MVFDEIKQGTLLSCIDVDSLEMRRGDVQHFEALIPVLEKMMVGYEGCLMVGEYEFNPAEETAHALVVELYDDIQITHLAEKQTVTYRLGYGNGVVLQGDVGEEDYTIILKD